MKSSLNAVRKSSSVRVATECMRGAMLYFKMSHKYLKRLTGNSEAPRLISLNTCVSCTPQMYCQHADHSRGRPRDWWKDVGCTKETSVGCSSMKGHTDSMFSTLPLLKQVRCHSCYDKPSVLNNREHQMNVKHCLISNRIHVDLLIVVED